MELENARAEAKHLLALQNQTSTSVGAGGGGGGGGSLLDELADPKDEQLHLLEEERDQLLNDLKVNVVLFMEVICVICAKGHQGAVEEVGSAKQTE